MTIHVLVEGPSEQAFLERWAKRLLKAPFRVHPHQGKGRLPKNGAASQAPKPRARGVLDQLPAKLRAYASALDPKCDGVLVLVDADDDEQAQLAGDIQAAIETSEVQHALVALAVEETEAFYLGDLGALRRAFPNADMTKARAYHPDSICDTWELFGRIIGDGGETRSHGPKPWAIS